MAIRAISLFAGVGGLDLGVGLAIPRVRTVCYVEVEAYAAAVLAARMQEGSLDDAPIYSDIASFDGRHWRAQVDLVHGGIPCQPYSLAGERKGDEDERALWPEFARVVAECRPSLVFIENVPAFVMGGGFRPLGEELCRLGYELEDPLFLSAEDVGAPHIRERVFILAHSKRAERWPVVRRELDRQGAGGRKTTGETPHASGALADAEGLDRREREPGRGQVGRAASGGASGELAHPNLTGQRILRCGRKSGKRFLTPLGNDAHGCEPRVRGEGEVGGEPVPDAELDALRERTERGGDRTCEAVTWHALPFPVGLYPPGPKDFDGWGEVLETAPWIAPAIEPKICRSLVELAGWVDRDLNPDDMIGSGGSDDKTEARPPEKVRSLRSRDDEKEIPERDAGGDERIQEEKILRPPMHGSGVAVREPRAASLDAAGSPVQRAILQAVRNHQEPPGPPQGQEPGEQRPIEFGDAVLILSHALASREWGHSQLSTETAVQCLREAIVSLWPVQHMPDPQEEIWGSIPDEGKRWIIVEAGLRYLNRNRAHRLRCAGNGVVPECAAQALTTLLDWAGLTNDRTEGGD